MPECNHLLGYDYDYEDIQFIYEYADELDEVFEFCPLCGAKNTHVNQRIYPPPKPWPTGEMVEIAAGDRFRIIKSFLDGSDIEDFVDEIYVCATVDGNRVKFFRDGVEYAARRDCIEIVELADA